MKTLKKTKSGRKTRRNPRTSNQGSVFFSFNDDISKLSIKSCKKCKDQIDIKISDPVLMSDLKAISHVYTRAKRVIQFDGVSATLDNNKYPTIFGSNIDTIMFCYALKKFRRLFVSAKTLFELGVGGGFISKYIVSKFAITSAVLNDINPESIKYVTEDLNLPVLKKTPIQIKIQKKPFPQKIIEKNGYTFIEADGLKYLNLLKTNGLRFDWLVCNPPYIPKNALEEDLDLDNPNFFEGTRLLRFLLMNFTNFSNKLTMIVSSTSLLNPFVVDSLKKVKFQLLFSKKVPLKVYNEKGQFLEEDAEYYKFLTKNQDSLKINGVSFARGAIISKGALYPMEHIVYILHCG